MEKMTITKENRIIMKVKEIKKSDYLTIAQIKTIPQTISDWLGENKDIDSLVGDTINGIIKIENAEWTTNYNGKLNSYDSELTIWVTAIVEIEPNVIKRMGFDLFDAMMRTEENNYEYSKFIY